MLLLTVALLLSNRIQTSPRSAKVDPHPTGCITLHCTACGRSAVYIDRGVNTPPISEAPWSR